uniref:Uncharacterized protein n=1 Tax=Oryza rufipogon TaxID=4529 RepID=A0A0E0QIK2_ORYRU
MLRNCELKITTWAIGVAVYTVRDTKVKCSRLETHTNRETIVLTLLCTLVSLLAGIWLSDHSNELGVIPYFRKKDFSNPNEIENYKWRRLQLMDTDDAGAAHAATPPARGCDLRLLRSDDYVASLPAVLPESRICSSAASKSARTARLLPRRHRQLVGQVASREGVRDVDRSLLRPRHRSRHPQAPRLRHRRHHQQPNSTRL